MIVARLMRSQARGMQMRATRNVDPKYHVPFESTRIATLDRFEDEAPPSNDEQIVAHYLKHHPVYEFRDFEEFHVDPYRHWLHARGEYYNTETSPAQVSPWEQGNKMGHLFFALLPFLSFFFVGNAYKEHCKQKGLAMPIVGVFSQCSC